MSRVWKLRGGRVIMIFDPTPKHEVSLRHAFNMVRSEVMARANFVLVRKEPLINRFMFMKCRSLQTREDVEDFEPIFAELGRACRRVVYDHDIPVDEVTGNKALHITFPSDSDLLYMRMLG